MPRNLRAGFPIARRAGARSSARATCPLLCAGRSSDARCAGWLRSCVTSPGGDVIEPRGLSRSGKNTSVSAQRRISGGAPSPVLVPLGGTSPAGHQGHYPDAQFSKSLNTTTHAAPNCQGRSSRAAKKNHNMLWSGSRPGTPWAPAVGRGAAEPAPALPGWCSRLVVCVASTALTFGFQAGSSAEFGFFELCGPATRDRKCRRVSEGRNSALPTDPLSGPSKLGEVQTRLTVAFGGGRTYVVVGLEVDNGNSD